MKGCVLLPWTLSLQACTHACHVAWPHATEARALQACAMPGQARLCPYHQMQQPVRCDVTSRCDVPLRAACVCRGPILLEDYHLVEKLAQFDRERIPERVVHARGATAKGFFEVRLVDQHCSSRAAPHTLPYPAALPQHSAR